MKYLAVVVGEIEEMEELAPDWFTRLHCQHDWSLCKPNPLSKVWG